MKVGFIGLGVMGGPMALNIVKKGHQLTVYDSNPEAIAKLEEKLTALEGRPVGRGPRGAGPAGPPTLSRVSADQAG